MIILIYHIPSVIRLFFFFHNNPKHLDLSYKMELDFELVLEGKNLHYIAKFHWTDLVICNHSREENPVL